MNFKISGRSYVLGGLMVEEYMVFKGSNLGDGNYKKSIWRILVYNLIEASGNFGQYINWYI